MDSKCSPWLVRWGREEPTSIEKIKIKKSTHEATFRDS